MGCGTSRSMSPESGNDSGKRGVVTTKKVPAIGVGHPVGGGFRAVDKREAQLVAAESRAKKAASRGMVTPNRVNALNESGKKQELIGKINAVYNSLNKEIPLGLNLATVEQLQDHYMKVSSIL